MLTPADSRAIVVGSVLEKAWQAQVRGWAQFGGWLDHATFDSRRSPAGYPDLTLVHPRRGLLAFLELKKESGVLRPEQRIWLAGLTVMVCDTIVVAVWRPSQADLVRAWLLHLDDHDPPPSLPEPLERRSPRRLAAARTGRGGTRATALSARAHRRRPRRSTLG